MSEWYEKVIYEEDSRLLSWLMFRTSAELFGEDEKENLDLMTDEEESWARTVAKYGKDEQTFVFIKPHIEAPHIETGIGTYDDTPTEEPSGHDWVSSETRKPDGTIRNEFREDMNSMADRPTENFFLGLAGVVFDSGYTSATHIKCSKCFILSPKSLDECQNCGNTKVWMLDKYLDLLMAINSN